MTNQDPSLGKRVISSYRVCLSSEFLIEDKITSVQLQIQFTQNEQLQLIGQKKKNSKRATAQQPPFFQPNNSTFEGSEYSTSKLQKQGLLRGHQCKGAVLTTLFTQQKSTYECLQLDMGRLQSDCLACQCIRIYHDEVFHEVIATLDGNQNFL